MEELTPLARLAKHGLERQDHASLGHAARFAWQRGVDTGEMRYALLWRLLCVVQDSMDESGWTLSPQRRAQVSALVRDACDEVLRVQDPAEGARLGAQWLTRVQRKIDGDG